MYTEREKAQQVNAERYPNTFPRFPHTPRYGIKYRFTGCTLPFSLSEIDGDTAYFVTRQGEESRVVNRANWHTLRPTS